MRSDMKEWTEIRRRVLVEGASKRSIRREYGVGWQTLSWRRARNTTRSGRPAFLLSATLALRRSCRRGRDGQLHQEGAGRESS